MMIHPDTELRPVNETIGVGVFATRPLPRGTIVWVLDRLDQRVSPERMTELGSRYRSVLERYAYLSSTGEHILCWDLARWVNHSCNANVLSTGWDFDIAVRDIAEGEELTNDYGCLNLENSFVCGCRAQNCRGTIHPDDFERFVETWDGRTRDAFANTGQLSQPLWEWLPNKRRVAATLADPNRLPSVRRHLFVPPPRPTTRKLRALSG